MYNFYWYGKENNIKKAYEPSIYKLVEDKESSKNWDNTENLYIEGDNLEVLKLLQKSYFGKVKMIYIDPPYNSGKDFVYKDNFRDSIANYKEITNQTTKANAETSGRYHTDWLNMMYPRLKLAKNLLTEDGVIFISIDDNEVINLKKICDEIFGENNFICDFIIESNPRGSQASKHIANVHEYLLMYSKNTTQLVVQGFEKTNENLSEYKEEDKNGKYRLLGLRQRGGAWRREDRPNMYYPIYVNPKNSDVSLKKTDEYTIEVLPQRPTGEHSRWTWGKEKFEKEKHLLTGKLVRKSNQEDAWDIFRKDYLFDISGNQKTQKPKSIWNDKEINYQNGRTEIKTLLSNSEIFDFPKPTILLEKVIKMLGEGTDTILDFFSGSATTAHAVMQLNAEDGGNRKFIMVQLPEETDEKSEAYKNGYKTICEIGKERIRRVGDKILEENKDKEGIEKLDIGFKVFKLEVDNMRTFFENNYNEDSIKVDWILKPKGNVLEKIKINNELHYIVESENNYMVYSNNSKRKEGNKTYYIVSIFNKNDCKDIMYHQLEGYYVEKLIEFNQGWYHDNYVTCRILDEVYKYLNK